ncbi:C4b-binding protein alpha chain-like isoform X2 [Heptranchias perlo]|uniref:C4b-binding protein alpha chain-like isoform X2 n=1 Tax=Heptranchias perlo TaxID=212740 RepID=UPI00355AA76E
MAEKLILALLAISTAGVTRGTGVCINPPQLENGSPTDESISQNTFPVGAKVTYRCFKGYMFQEGSLRHVTCRQNSTWSPLQATCEPKNCGNPGEILNGYYNASSTTFGNKATFYCDEGYQMVGRPYRFCTADGWDGQVPTCEPIICPDLPPISNGTVSSPVGEFWTFGMIATYSCDSGYSLIGAGSIACTKTGKWDKDPPTCKAVKCHRPEDPANCQIMAGLGPTYKYRETITYRCTEGFEMIGESVIICSENSTFVPRPPTCEPRIVPTTTTTTGIVPTIITPTGVCINPPQLENGSPTDESISQNTFPVGAKVTYRCFKGYVFQEGSLRHVTCRQNSTWSPLQATCEPKNCGNPGEILNGYYNASSTTFGNKATFYCDEGYQMVGRPYRLCTAEGWDGQVPTCEPITCPDLPPISKGTVSSPVGEFWTFGMIATYSCDSGCSLIGAGSIACTKTGKWDKDPPTCKAVKCLRPEDPANCQIMAGLGPTYKYRETITYCCTKGFEMIGESVIFCSENSTFVPRPPTCEPRIVPTTTIITATGGYVGTNVGQQSELLLILGVTVFLVMSCFD